MRLFHHRKAFVALTAVILAGVVALARVQTPVHASDPLVGGFFVKYVDCRGISVRSAAAVEDRALRLACSKLRLMLRHIPDARAQLVQRGAELHVIAGSEQTSDLPEFRAQRGKVHIDHTGRSVTIDESTRGKGGPLSSCDEENLLRPPGDRYGGGRDVCIHEFAHAIMDYGLAPAERQRIRDQYQQALQSGLWRGAYAATNPQEYWAELSMWYFGAHGDRRMQGTPPADGPQGLKDDDPGVNELLDRLYAGAGA